MEISGVPSDNCTQKTDYVHNNGNIMATLSTSKDILMSHLNDLQASERNTDYLIMFRS